MFLPPGWSGGRGKPRLGEKLHELLEAPNKIHSVLSLFKWRILYSEAANA